MYDAFFSAIIKEFDLKKYDVDIVAVLHILPDSIPFVRALSHIGDIGVIIPKPKSINKNSLKELETFPIRQIGRDNICNVLKDLSRDTVFLDIGGYFSGIVDEIRAALGESFLGIIEDTENGLQRYENLDEIVFPFLSVARSPLKDNEDVMVGQAVAFSAEALLREHSILFNGLRVGVIGYGKIGKSVAQSVELKHGNAMVYDKDNVRLTHALSSGFEISGIENLLGLCDVVCLATGNKSLSSNDFSKLKNASWVFSVTSSDDEIDKEWLNFNYAQERISKYAVKYSKGDHYFYLLNEGDAVNFIHDAVVGDYILLVQAELLLSAYSLIAKNAGNLQREMSSDVRDRICRIWLSIFSKNIL